MAQHPGASVNPIPTANNPLYQANGFGTGYNNPITQANGFGATPLEQLYNRTHGANHTYSLGGGTGAVVGGLGYGGGLYSNYSGAGFGGWNSYGYQGYGYGGGNNFAPMNAGMFNAGMGIPNGPQPGAVVNGLGNPRSNAGLSAALNGATQVMKPATRSKSSKSSKSTKKTSRRR